MGVVVQKYGGSSVADAAGVKRVAQRIADTRRAGNDVVVVVSHPSPGCDDDTSTAAPIAPNSAVVTQRPRLAALPPLFESIRVPPCGIVTRSCSHAGALTSRADIIVRSVFAERSTAGMPAAGAILCAGALCALSTPVSNTFVENATASIQMTE